MAAGSAWMTKIFREAVAPPYRPAITTAPRKNNLIWKAKPGSEWMSDQNRPANAYQVASPVAVTSYMLAAKYEARADEVAGLVVVSTLLSVPAIPLLLAFFV